MVSVLMLVSLSGITDAIMEVLMSWGYVGMLLAAFLAGSFFPFSSEAVMLAFQAAGLSPMTLVVYATIGNVLGSVFNYGVGRLGKLDWIERYLHVKRRVCARQSASWAEEEPGWDSSLSCLC